MFAAMAAVLVMGLAIPKAFGDDGVLFGVRLPRRPAAVRRAVRRGHAATTPRCTGRSVGWRRMLLAPVLIAAAGFFDAGPCGRCSGRSRLTVTLLGASGLGDRGLAASRPAHFAERHGLIVIIALGESIVALGLAASEEPHDRRGRRRRVLGMARGGCLWWLYFDVVAWRRAAPRMATGAERNAIARDAYSYLHP